MRVLVTGASGFIGTRFTERVSRLPNYSVLAIRRGSTPARPFVQTLHISELTVAELDRVIAHQEIDLIVHLAAAGVHPSDRNAQTLFSINAIFPSTLVEWAARRKVKGVVLIGSSAEYLGDHAGIKVEESAPLETTKLYGASKAAGGILAMAMSSVLKVPTAYLRLFNVYGPGEAAHRLLPNLVKGLSLEQPVNLSEGYQVRDFIHVNDVVDAVLTAGTALVNGHLMSGIYNVCTGRGVSVRDFAQLTAQALNATTSSLKFGALPMRPDEIMHLVGDPARFESVCAWRAQISLEAGIKSSVEEIRSNSQCEGLYPNR
jgi:nucleoside-diphosphate-sugar epimerase